MISCHRIILESRCRAVGISLSEAMQCVVERHGDIWTIDTGHKSYPASSSGGSTSSPAVQRAASGPGTELSKLLKRFGIEPTPTCACRAKAAEMDAWGPDECSKPERINEVVAVMRAEAEARGLPFVEIAAKLLVRRAIHNARQATQKDKMN